VLEDEIVQVALETFAQGTTRAWSTSLGSSGCRIS
jgi:hypothetical protein